MKADPGVEALEQQISVVQQELDEDRRVSESVFRTGLSLTADFDLERIVQTLTDEATSLCRAQFGAFVYNVTDAQGDAFMLYTLSGAPKEAFSSFPLPRATPLFAPTFRGEGIIRSDDIRKDPRYGRMGSQPAGHLPVVSYLGVPVVSRGGEVIGGLFFGHEEAAVFTAKDERAISVMASQAAIAIDNARLFARAKAQQEEQLRRSRQASLIAAIGVVVTGGGALPEMLQACAATMVHHMDAAFAQVWRYDADDQELVLEANAAAGGKATEGAPTRVGFSHGKVGFVASTRQQVLANDIATDPHFAGDSWVLDEKLVAFAGFPLRVDAALIGVIAIYARRPFPEDMAFAMRTVSDTVALGILRKRAEEERAELLARAEVARLQAEAASRLKDEFLAMVSHELRTPLNAMLGWLRMLAAGMVDERGHGKAFSVIERNAQALQQLVDDLLDVSRIISGKLRLEVGPTDLKGVIDAAIDAIKPAADTKQVRVTSNVPNDIEPVIADATRLQQVVWNLLSNAVKFTPAGGAIEIALNRVESNAVIGVKDNGRGIDASQLPHVFDRFRQGQSGTTREFGGLGLGLAIVRHLVDLHGGSVGVESKGTGLGATFTVRLPLTSHLPRNAGTAKHGSGPIRTPAVLIGMRVLVVDDEPDATDLVCALLTSCKMKPIVASGAEEALVLLERERPDLLVSDIGMPRVDGYMLLERIRRHPDETLSKIPAIALTAFARGEERARALESGFDDHLPKPVDPEQLLKGMTKILSKRRRA